MRFLALPLFLLLTIAPALAQVDVAVGDITFSMPAHWKGPADSNESRLPYQASYTFSNDNTDSALYGARMIIHRIVGLDRIERERFLRGQLALGYNGLRPYAAVTQDEMMFPTARGYKTSGNERAGNIYFVQHGMTYYTIHLTASEDAFESQLPALLDIARSIRFLDG